MECGSPQRPLRAAGADVRPPRPRGDATALAPRRRPAPHRRRRVRAHRTHARRPDRPRHRAAGPP